MLALTDADREALGRLHTLMQHSTTLERDEAIYLAGLRAGLERAADECDKITDSAANHHPLVSKACAAAARALRDA